MVVVEEGEVIGAWIPDCCREGALRRDEVGAGAEIAAQELARGAGSRLRPALSEELSIERERYAGGRIVRNTAVLTGKPQRHIVAGGRELEALPRPAEKRPGCGSRQIGRTGPAEHAHEARHPSRVQPPSSNRRGTQDFGAAADSGNRGREILLRLGE